MRSIGIMAFILSVLFAATITWLNLSWKTIKQFTNETSQSRIDYYMSDFQLIDTDTAGNISYQLTADHLIHKQASGQSEIYRPHIKKQSADGQQLTIDSEKAIQAGKNGNITLVGDVQVLQKASGQSPGFTLLTQNLTYNPVKQQLSSQAKSDFISAQGSITGVGFETKLDDQELRILSNVQAEFKPSQ
ncbi:MAG: LPS export ABC transporter periplasmic protein LptC [Leucothrix sp.]